MKIYNTLLVGQIRNQTYKNPNKKKNAYDASCIYIGDRYTINTFAVYLSDKILNVS